MFTQDPRASLTLSEKTVQVHLTYPSGERSSMPLLKKKKKKTEKESSRKNAEVFISLLFTNVESPLTGSITCLLQKSIVIFYGAAFLIIWKLLQGISIKE